MTATPIELPREVSTFRGINLSAPAFRARTELAKHGDVGAIDSILETILKPERVVQLKEKYKNPENITWIPISALVDGENLIPFAFAKQLEKQVGGEVFDGLSFKKGRALPHRFVKRGEIRLAKEARVEFGVAPETIPSLKGKTVILVDDQFKTGGTLRDAMVSLAREDIKVSGIQTLGAGRSIEFAPRPEIWEASKKEILVPERVSIIEEQTGISVNNLTNAELSSINRIAKETKTLEGFEHELKRINEEYQEAGRKYSSEQTKRKGTLREIHERVEAYKPARAKEVTLPQKLPPESKVKPIGKNSTYVLMTERRVAYFQEREDYSKAEAERQSSPEKKAKWLKHAEDMRKERASCEIGLEAALEKKEATAAATKEKFIQVRKVELANLEKLKFSFKAKFADEKIVVLGAADDFEPYKTATKGKRDLTQLMVRRPDGSRAIMMASQIHVAGKPLLTPTPRGLFPPMWKSLATKAEEVAIPKELEPLVKKQGKIQREVSNSLS